MNDKSKPEEATQPKPIDGASGPEPAKNEGDKVAAAAKAAPVAKKAAPAAKPASAAPASQPTVKARKPLSKDEYARTTQARADSTSVIPAIKDDDPAPSEVKPAAAKTAESKAAKTKAAEPTPADAKAPAAKKAAPVATPPAPAAAKSPAASAPKAAAAKADTTKTVQGDPLLDTASLQAIDAETKSAAPATKTEVIPAVKAPAQTSEPESGKEYRRNIRRKLSYIEPWSVTKMAFVVSVAMMIVIVVAVVVFWFVLQVTGVWQALNDSIVNVLSDGSADFDVNDYVGLARITGLALIVSAFNVVFSTALATIGAHLYNLAAGMMGGIEVTFEDRKR